MIDLEFIRKNPHIIKQVINSGRGNPEKVNINKWLELDAQRKKILTQQEELNRERNKLAERGKNGDIEGLKEEGRKIKEDIQQLEERLKLINNEWQDILDWIPNIPLDDVPLGLKEEDNIEIKAWNISTGYFDKEKLQGNSGSSKYMPHHTTHSQDEFTLKPHWEIGKELDIIDIEAGAKVSGSRFYYIKKDGALLIYAIFNLLMKKLLSEEFYPMVVPILVKERALYGSSHFPGDKDQVYKIDSEYLEEQNQLYLLGSSEPSNFAYFMDKTLTKEELPIKIMTQTPCFRSEVGSWGKDVRGIKRTHQFDKLEMNIIMEANLEKAKHMHEYLLSLNEWLLQQLEIPYHVINMCIGDLGYYAAAKKYDVEVWLPSQSVYMETMSNSITTDYQTRRLNIKYKNNNQTHYAYTLNDTGATHRLLIAIIEHYQQNDGSIKVPKVLQDFVGKEYIKKKVI